MEFENPSNGYSERVTGWTVLWVALTGAFYFMVRGAWRYAALWLLLVPLGTIALIALVFGSGTATLLLIDGQVLALLVLLAPQVGFALLAPGMLRKHYLRQGWRQVGRA